MAKRQALALVAHDEKKDDLVRFARRHRKRLAGYDLYATGTTGSRINAALRSSTSRHSRAGRSAATSRSAR